MEKKTLLTLAALLAFSSLVFSDTIYLKDGGEVRGKITDEDENEVIIKTSIATFTIERNSIEKIVLEQLDDNTGEIQDESLLRDAEKIASLQKDVIDVEINPMIELDFKSKEEVFDIRKNLSGNIPSYLTETTSLAKRYSAR